jgi:hypothetical protein
MKHTLHQKQSIILALYTRNGNRSTFTQLNAHCYVTQHLDCRLLRENLPWAFFLGPLARFYGVGQCMPRGNLRTQANRDLTSRLLVGDCVTVAGYGHDSTQIA